MTNKKHALEDIITAWRDFERDNNPEQFAKNIQELNKMIPLEDYVKTYKLYVYQPIIKEYFNKAAELFEQYQKEIGVGK